MSIAQEVTDLNSHDSDSPGESLMPRRMGSAYFRTGGRLRRKGSQLVSLSNASHVRVG
jgi:hypothetical protein